MAEAEAAQSVSLQLQKKEISALIKSSLKKGATWFLVDAKWFKQWKKYVGYDNWDVSLAGEESANPGPIDNSPLMEANGTTDTLKDHLMDELDFVLVPEEAWQKLTSWYGTVAGQEPFPRKVIEQGMFTKHCKVEVYLMDLKLCDYDDLKKIHVRLFSRADPVEVIKTTMRGVFSIEDDVEIRLWNKYTTSTFELLDDKGNGYSIQDAGLCPGQVIVVERKKSDGTWPRQVPSKNLTSFSVSSISGSSTSFGAGGSSSSSISNYESNSGSYPSSYFNSSYESNTRNRGLCGLSNLGNTCFMNSAIQCLSNVHHLTEYMLSDRWQGELNTDNPLGMRGEIATTFAELIKNMWSGKFTYTVPRNFKVAVGRFQPQFSGYQQQDSQELMAFLLDGLHEDLNRIKHKPYIEVKDADDRPDHDVAKEAWENYLRRNDSIIVDIFHGLLKSTLICPACNKVSVTFDPFCYLSLPLPIKKERQIEVFFVSDDPAKKLTQYKVTVPKLGTVNDICKALSTLTSVPADHMMVTDVYNHRFHKIFPPEDGLNHILDRDDIFVHQIPTKNTNDSDHTIIPVYMREKNPHSSKSYNNSSTQLFGQPLLVAVPKKNCSYDMLYQAVLKKMSRYVTSPAEQDEWWKTVSNGSSEESNLNGEMEVNDEADNSSEDSIQEASEVIQEEADDKQSSRAPRLFTFHFVNSYGSTEMQSIRDDGKMLKFPSRCYLAIDWHPKAKQMFYDEKAAEDFESDPSMNAKTVQKRHVQLTECLDLFTTTEQLGEQDLWYCPQCKKHRQATKKFDVWQLPRVLVVHLKRFSCNKYWRDKLDSYVEFPTRGLCLKKWLLNQCHGSATYDLISVSNHYGGMGGGHYTAYGKNKDTGEWYHFDDSSVTATSEDSVVTKAAYVLVYLQRDLSQGAESSRGQAASPSASGAAGENSDFSPSEEIEMDLN